MRLARKILLSSLLPLTALAVAVVFAPSAPLQGATGFDAGWLSHALVHAKALFA